MSMHDISVRELDQQTLPGHVAVVRILWSLILEIGGLEVIPGSVDLV